MTKLSATRISLLATVLLVSCLPGCYVFNDSAAMRIEVEVYKGPLSLEPEIQLGELYGYLIEAQNGLIRVRDVLETVGEIGELGDSPPNNGADPNNENSVKTWCENIGPRGLAQKDIDPTGWFSRIDYFHCRLLKSLDDDADSLSRKLILPICALHSTGACSASIHAATEISVKKFQKQISSEKWSSQVDSIAPHSGADVLARYNLALRAASETAAAMQAAAFRYATASTAGRPTKFKVRVAMVHFIAAASEYGNQIQARADALLKQLGPEGRDRRELPLSVHLRGAEPTDFVHLYEWSGAHTPQFLDYLLFGSTTPIGEKIKIIDRLYADHFWSKINTVYASGRGKAQMAFIKDETGNWNLKSFDNDPTELLDAYTKVTKSALEGVVEIAGEIASGGADAGFKKAADELLAIARQTDPDKPLQATLSGGALSLNHLRARIDGQLNAKHVRTDLNKDKELMDKVKTAKEASDEVKASLEKAKQDSTLSTQILAEEEKTTGTALENAQKDLAAHRKTVIEKWAALIDDHSQLVDLLSSTVTKQ